MRSQLRLISFGCNAHVQSSDHDTTAVTLLTVGALEKGTFQIGRDSRLAFRS